MTYFANTDKIDKMKKPFKKCSECKEDCILDKEFNLSDWIVEHPEGHAIRPCHVKEFIKKLKESYRRYGTLQEIDKLAGPKLI